MSYFWALDSEPVPRSPGGERVRPIFRDDEAYAYVVAKIRVLETRLLTRAHLLRIVDAPDAEAALRLLAETEYGPAVAAAESAADYETVLALELGRVFRLLAENAPEPQLLSVLAAGYDWRNLKIALKAAVSGKSLDPRHIVDAGELDRRLIQRFSAGEPESILSAQPYGEAVRRARDAFAMSGDVQEIDLILDAARFSSTVLRARAWHYDLLSVISQAHADLVNLRTLVRLNVLGAAPALFRRALVPGGAIPEGRLAGAYGLGPEGAMAALAGLPQVDAVASGVRAFRQTGSLATLDKLIDDRLLGLCRGAKYSAFGPDAVIAYLLAKETEIKNLRIIFTGKLNGLPQQTIRERLRETYV